MRQNLEDSSARDFKVLNRFRFGKFKSTVATGFQITSEMGPLLFLDASAGVATIKLPAIDITNEGMMLIVVSVGATNTITVKESTNTTTIGTILAGNAAFYVNDGTTWYQLLFPLS